MLKNNTELLRQWLRTCPYLSKDKKAGIDYLSDTPTEYSIFSSPSTLQYRENILGEKILADTQTLNFIFASKEVYGADALQNAQNLRFHEQVAGWINEKNARGEFPDWNDGKVTAVVPTLTPYPVRIGPDTAQYQIQLQVTYRR